MNARTVVTTPHPEKRFAVTILELASTLEVRDALAPSPATSREIQSLRAMAREMLQSDRETAAARAWVRPGPVAPQRTMKVMAELSDTELVQLRAALRGGRA